MPLFSFEFKIYLVSRLCYDICEHEVIVSQMHTYARVWGISYAHVILRVGSFQIKAFYLHLWNFCTQSVDGPVLNFFRYLCNALKWLAMDALDLSYFKYT